MSPHRCHAAQVRTGDKIRLLVARQAGVPGPLCIWFAAQAQEQPARVNRLLLAGLVICERDRFQVVCAVQFRDFSAGPTVMRGEF